MLRIPTGRRQTSWLFYKRGRGVELGSTVKQLQLVVRAGLEPGTSGFQVQRPNHSTTLLPLIELRKAITRQGWVNDENMSPIARNDNVALNLQFIPNFGLSLHFIPSLQSAVCILYLVCILYPVCSLQSAVCSLHFVLTGEEFFLALSPHSSKQRLYIYTSDCFTKKATTRKPAIRPSLINILRD